MAQGQSFGWKFLSEFFSPNPDNVCSFCFEATRPTFNVHINLCNLAFERMKKMFPNQTHSFSSSVLAEFLRADDSFRIYEPLGFVDEYHAVCSPGDLLELVETYHDRAIDLLLPGNVSQLEHLKFIPRPSTPSTRFIGSWIGPCLSCGVFVVSHWANWLTGPTSRNSPTCILFNLDEGMTSEEQMAYDLEMAMNKQDRSFVNSPSRPNCLLCQKAIKRHDENILFFSSTPVCLRPVPDSQSMSVPRFNLTHVVVPARSLPLNDQVCFPVIPALAPCYDSLSSPSKLWLLNGLSYVKATAKDAETMPSSVVGFTSGVRSALVQIRDVWYRIKGCGNGIEGFGIQGQPLNVRGCMFEDTAAREMYMCGLVNDVLVRNGWPVAGANHPVGFFRYPDSVPEDLIGKLAWTHGVDKFACVSRTMGDRRLGNHLLSGLEQVICKADFELPSTNAIRNYCKVW